MLAHGLNLHCSRACVAETRLAHPRSLLQDRRARSHLLRAVPVLLSHHWPSTYSRVVCCLARAYARGIEPSRPLAKHFRSHSRMRRFNSARTSGSWNSAALSTCCDAIRTGLPPPPVLCCTSNPCRVTLALTALPLRSCSFRIHRAITAVFALPLLLPTRFAITAPPPLQGLWSVCIRAVPSIAFSLTASNILYARFYCPLCAGPRRAAALIRLHPLQPRHVQRVVRVRRPHQHVARHFTRSSQTRQSWNTRAPARRRSAQLLLLLLLLLPNLRSPRLPRLHARLRAVTSPAARPRPSLAPSPGAAPALQRCPSCARLRLLPLAACSLGAARSSARDAPKPQPPTCSCAVPEPRPRVRSSAAPLWRRSPSACCSTRTLPAPATHPRAPALRRGAPACCSPPPQRLCVISETAGTFL
jgi:hypothetical protein